MKIKIYSSPSCTFCESLKKYFLEKRVEFEEIDVTSSKQALDELMEKTGMLSVPVTLIDDKVIIGFDKNEIDKTLNL